MKKLLPMLFLLSACSAKNEPVVPAQNPQCGVPGPAQASCIKFPPLSEEQKKLVFTTLTRESENQDAVSLYMFSGGADSAFEAELMKLLGDGSCQKETSQEPDGRSLGKISGTSCHVAARSSFLNVSTPEGAKEALRFDLQVLSEEYAAHSQIKKLSRTEDSEAKVTEIVPKHLKANTQGSMSGAYESIDGTTMQFSGGIGGTSEVDTTNDQDIKIISLDLYSTTFMRYQKFAAILHITMKKAEGGPTKLEAFLNDEPINLGTSLTQKILRKTASNTIRSALSGL